KALAWSAVYIAIALVFNAGVYMAMGVEKAEEFLTGYILEKSLSVDNLFVFTMIFSYFNIPAQYQPRVLKWGIVGALVMRAIFIFLGYELLKLFHWMIYIFGGFLVLTGIKMALQKEKRLEPEKNPLVRLFRRWMPLTGDFHGERFFVKVGEVRHATPLFIALLLIESTDLVFAIDSVPAIFAITGDPFIVYTSNVFAILGLRALYFALAGIMGLFRYLQTGLSVVLVFVGFKMMLVDIYKVSTLLSLGIILGVLGLSVLASLISEKRPSLKREA
ncbi:MAG: TerC family protein, partial [Candidatus Hydrothermarchaeota archaeon]